MSIKNIDEIATFSKKFKIPRSFWQTININADGEDIDITIKSISEVVTSLKKFKISWCF